jgi:hypothetical protein
MTGIIIPLEFAPLTMRSHTEAKTSDRQFFQLCQSNRDLGIECNASGEVILMVELRSSTDRLLDLQEKMEE